MSLRTASFSVSGGRLRLVGTARQRNGEEVRLIFPVRSEEELGRLNRLCGEITDIVGLQLVRFCLNRHFAGNRTEIRKIVFQAELFPECPVRREEELLPEDVPLRQFNRQEHPLRGRVEVAERHVEEQFLSRVCVRTGDLGRRDGDVGRLPAE